MKPYSALFCHVYLHCLFWCNKKRCVCLEHAEEHPPTIINNCTAHKILEWSDQCKVALNSVELTANIPQSKKTNIALYSLISPQLTFTQQWWRMPTIYNVEVIDPLTHWDILTLKSTADVSIVNVGFLLKKRPQTHLSQEKRCTSINWDSNKHSSMKPEPCGKPNMTETRGDQAFLLSWRCEMRCVNVIAFPYTLMPLNIPLDRSTYQYVQFLALCK